MPDRPAEATSQVILAKTKQHAAFPSREQLLAFIKDHTGEAGTREIARAFGLKNADRAQLKRVLRDLADEGAVEKRRKTLHKPGTLPPVTLAEIVERDRDGEIIAVPTEWDEEAHGEVPRIRVLTPRKLKPGEAAGIGDRALLRIEKLSERDGTATYSGRVIKVLDRARKRTIGIFRSLPGGGGRLVPVDKKALGRELAIAPNATLDAEDGELVAADVAKEGRFGLPSARIKERLGSLKGEKAVSLIAIHAHDIPHVFSREALAEADAAKPADLSGGREDWRKLPLVTIDRPMPRTTTTRSMPSPTPAPTTAAAISSRSRSPMWPIMYGPARRSIARRWTAAIQSISRTVWCRCCRSASPTICVR